MRCVSTKCIPSTCGVEFAGTTMHVSEVVFSFPPSNPESPMIFPPLSFAYFTALSKFCDQGPALSLPEPPWTLIATNTSPFRKKFLSCSENTPPHPLSFVKALTSGMLSTSENARNLWTASSDTHLLRSQARCVAVEAEPPFPAVKTWHSFVHAS